MDDITIQGASLHQPVHFEKETAIVGFSFVIYYLEKYITTIVTYLKQMNMKVNSNAHVVTFLISQKDLRAHSHCTCNRIVQTLCMVQKSYHLTCRMHAVRLLPNFVRNISKLTRGSYIFHILA